MPRASAACPGLWPPSVQSPCDVEACKSGYQPDRCADARSPAARQPRTATGILSRVAWCIRCLLSLLSQPSSALLSQKATHNDFHQKGGNERHKPSCTALQTWSGGGEGGPLRWRTHSRLGISGAHAFQNDPTPLRLLARPTQPNDTERSRPHASRGTTRGWVREIAERSHQISSLASGSPASALLASKSWLGLGLELGLGLGLGLGLP